METFLLNEIWFGFSWSKRNFETGLLENDEAKNEKEKLTAVVGRGVAFPIRYGQLKLQSAPVLVNKQQRYTNLFLSNRPFFSAEYSKPIWNKSCYDFFFIGLKVHNVQRYHFVWSNILLNYLHKNAQRVFIRRRLFLTKGNTPTYDRIAKIGLALCQSLFNLVKFSQQNFIDLSLILFVNNKIIFFLNYFSFLS